VIKPSEDGMRTGGASGTYEWWYFDAHLDDSAKLVVVFLTKEFTDLDKPLSPAIRIDLTLPDGTAVNYVAEFAAETFSASSETCDVRIGDNVFTGDLHTYTIKARVEDVEVDITLTVQLDNGESINLWDLLDKQGEQQWATVLHRDGSESVVPVTPLATDAIDFQTSPTTGQRYAGKWDRQDSQPEHQTHRDGHANPARNPSARALQPRHQRSSVHRGG
jgi:hypothetical protein